MTYNYSKLSNTKHIPQYTSLTSSVYDVLSIFNSAPKQDYSKLKIKTTNFDATFTIPRFVHDVYMLKEYDSTAVKIQLVTACLANCPTFTEKYPEEIVEFNSALFEIVKVVLTNTLKVAEESDQYVIGELLLYITTAQHRYVEICKFHTIHLFPPGTIIDKNEKLPFSNVLSRDMYKKNYEQYLLNVLTSDSFFDFKCLFIIFKSKQK